MTPHMLLITSRGEVKRDQAAVICDREYLEALGHAGMDEMGQWAVENSRTLRAGVADARMYQLAEQERERKLAESVRHIAECGGYSFCQGNEPCYPHCAEMAVYEPPSTVPRSFRRWLADLLTDLRNSI